jgi:hypothetical protein
MKGVMENDPWSAIMVFFVSCFPKASKNYTNDLEPSGCKHYFEFINN